MGLNSETRTKNAAKNITAAFMNKIILLLLTFVSRKIFIQYIGVEYLGIHSLFANILTLLAMADLGLSTAMNVSLYRPIADKDTRKLSALMHYYKKLYNYIAAAITVIGIALVPFLKYLVRLDSDIPHLTVYYLMYLANTVISYLFIYKAALINADQKNYLVNKVAIWVNVLKVIVQIIVVIVFHLYIIYVAVEIFATLLNNIVISTQAERIYPFLRDKSNDLSKTEKKDIFNNISSVFLYKISYSLINGTDNILISVIVGTVTVGLYSNYLSITTNLESMIAILFSSLTAGIGNLVAMDSGNKQYRTFKTMQMVSFWICGIVSTALLLLTQDFITLWLGKEYALENLVLLAIVCNTFFSTCMRPVWTFREGTGMYAQIRYIMVVTAVLNLILSVVLGKWIGLSGILFATSISKISTYFWYEPNILFKKFFKTKVRYYYLEYAKNFALVLISVIICAFATYFINIITVFTWGLKAVICVGITCFIYFLAYRKTEEFAFMIVKIKSLLRRKQSN